MIEVILALACYAGGICKEQSITISRESAAIASCESGDTEKLGSIDWKNTNVNVDGTVDAGAWQFNNYWVWNPNDRWAIIPVANGVYGITSAQFIKQWPTPLDAPPSVQYAMFQSLWDDGYGWRHWKSSQPCWSKWMIVNKKGRAVWR
jgi:hypothetical protein